MFVMDDSVCDPTVGELLAKANAQLRVEVERIVASRLRAAGADAPHLLQFRYCLKMWREAESSGNAAMMELARNIRDFLLDGE